MQHRRRNRIVQTNLSRVTARRYSLSSRIGNILSAFLPPPRLPLRCPSHAATAADCIGTNIISLNDSFMSAMQRTTSLPMTLSTIKNAVNGALSCDDVRNRSIEPAAAACRRLCVHFVRFQGPLLAHSWVTFYDQCTLKRHALSWLRWGTVADWSMNGELRRWWGVVCRPRSVQNANRILKCYVWQRVRTCSVKSKKTHLASCPSLHGQFYLERRVHFASNWIPCYISSP